MSFGNITSHEHLSYITGISNAEDDLLNPGCLLIAERNKLYGQSLETAKYYEFPVINSTFGQIRALLQISQSEVMLSHQQLNCICILKRHSEYAEIQSVIGNCGEKGSYADGPYADARFDGPHKIAESQNKDSYFVAEKKHVRRLSMEEQEVSTIFPQEDVDLKVHDISALAVTDKYLYIASANVVFQQSLSSGSSTVLTGTIWGFGHDDGPCLLASTYYFISSMLVLDEHTLLLSDFGNQNLRIINTLTSTSSTVCLPSKQNNIIEGHFFGSKSLCHIEDSFTLFYSNNLKAVVVFSSQSPILLPVHRGKQNTLITIFTFKQHGQFHIDGKSHVWLVDQHSKLCIYMCITFQV